ncbi:MAG: CoA ester lyase [Pseudomonadota bacterium]
MADPISASEFAPWRSLLFVPANRKAFVDKAHLRGADAYVLDLEDSVPDGQKATAREGIIEAAESVSRSGAAAVVRINQSLRLANKDLQACIHASVQALVIPKVASRDHINTLCERIDGLEAERGIHKGHTRLIAQIECVHGLANLDEIAQSSPRLLAMSLGSEDFSASAGMEPTPETLLAPNQAVVFACRRARILPLGFPASIADFSDATHFRKIIAFARQLGFVGALCIHPSQIATLNEAFSPSDTELENARQLISAYEQGLSKDLGAIEFNGYMVDAPVVARARALLLRYS